MEVVVLAGGKGTRLQTVVSDLPKPMAPVKDKPFLEYILEWLATYPVSHFVLSVGYKAEAISSYFGDNFKNIPITYAVEEQPLGTGGGIKYALKATSEENVLIINADTYFPIDVNLFAAFHKASNAQLSLALKGMKDFDRYGTVELVDDTIVRFNEKTFREEGLINGGIYFINASFMDSLSLPEVFSFETEVLEKQAPKGVLKGVAFNAPFLDIGIPEDYYRAGEFI